MLINIDLRKFLAEKPWATLAGVCVNLSGHQSIGRDVCSPKTFIFKQLWLQYTSSRSITNHIWPMLNSPQALLSNSWAGFEQVLGKLSFSGRFENIKIFAVKLRTKFLKSACFQQMPFINWLGSEFEITEKVFLETIKSHQDTWKEGLAELSLLVALIFTELCADIGHLVWHFETSLL